MSTSEQWLGDAEAKPAPEPLRRVQGLINTIDRESGQDRLTEVGDARPWLEANGLLTSAHPLTADDLDVLVGVREGLRALVIHNTGGPTPDPAATAPLRALADEVPVRAALDGDGRVLVGPVGDSVRARLLGLLLVVEAAQRDGTWLHLKACANDDCQWAFYDRSRNHGGTWCDMSTCGNKLKNRDFRARRRVAH
jgi:predicted RNA-binding Zn ribbon-like protein